MEQEVRRAALKRAVLTAVVMMAAFELVALLTLLINDLQHYLILDIRNPAHHVILAAVALTIGVYTYFRVYLKEKAERKPEDGLEGEEK
jgi:hypothetical protein